MIQQIRTWKKTVVWYWDHIFSDPAIFEAPLLHFRAGDPLTGNQCPPFVATIFGHPYCVGFLSTDGCMWVGCVRFSYRLAKGGFYI